jgi:alpha-D-ribose 1-methylphosphonate 5-triphosphate diphosphatase
MVAVFHDRSIMDRLMDDVYRMPPKENSNMTTEKRPLPPTCLIRNVRAVAPGEVLPEATVAVEQGAIREITTRPVAAAGASIDGRGRLLLPGFIDIHSDVIENAIQPRPGGRFPVDVALHELDKQLTACGVTSIYHCLCFLHSDENPPFRSAEMTELSDPPDP